LEKTLGIDHYVHHPIYGCPSGLCLKPTLLNKDKGFYDTKLSTPTWDTFYSPTPLKKHRLE